MTEQKVSPFTGRPIIEWIDDEIELHDADGDEIGNVVEIKCGWSEEALECWSGSVLF